MPAPKFLAGLPKPLLFGLYGAAGGFVGAFVFGTPFYLLMDFSMPADAQGRRRVDLVLLITSVWTICIATPMCLALLSGQYYYLRSGLPPGRIVAIGLAGGMVVGALSGFSAQCCFCFAPHDDFVVNSLFRTVAWALLGGLVGVGLSLFIPNMKWLFGLAGGAVGGAIGCIGFLAVTVVTGDTLGRLLGMTIVGFCIGAMVVIAETAFRRAWLEVRYGEREVVTVNLGPEPVKIGSDAKACTVWARGAGAVALRFFVRDGEVICDDREAGDETVAGDGFSREVGNVTVTVRTSGEPAAPEPRRRPVARPVSKTAAPPTPAVPPTKPTIKPTATDPNACPLCGRVVPGAPGGRYCMLCDRTY
jgi:hypothetical protein